jgi:hypothetical protein
MECWNLGMMGVKKPVSKMYIISLVSLFWSHILAKKSQKTGAWRASSKKVDSTFLVG